MTPWLNGLWRMLNSGSSTGSASTIAERRAFGPMGWKRDPTTWSRPRVGCPVKIVNDAAMQALGSYHGGKMLFLGLGIGFGSAMIVNGIVEPIELGHLPYKKGTYEDYVGRRGLERHGKKKWRRYVTDVVARLVAVLEPDDTVIGGSNIPKLTALPPGSRAGDNDNAFRGGFRLWERAPANGGVHSNRLA